MKIAASVTRLVLNVGGALALAQGYVIPHCGPTGNATIDTIMGMLAIAVGGTWGLVDAHKHQTRKDELGE